MCDLSSNIKKHMIDAFGEKRHRLQLKNRETSNCSFLKIADLTIDEAYAHKYLETVSDVHHFKTSSWKDIRIDILI